MPKSPEEQRLTELKPLMQGAERAEVYSANKTPAATTPLDRTASMDPADLNNGEVNKGVDFDTVLENISTGWSRFEVFYFVIIVAGMLSGGFIFYCTNYFTIDPVYTCILPGE